MTQKAESPAAAPTATGPELKTKQDSNNLPLFPDHYQKLKNVHGLHYNTISEANLFSADANKLNQILKRTDIQCNGICIPYSPDFIRARLDEALMLDGNEAKYLSPSGSTNRLYIPKPVIPILTDPSKTLFFTEGEFKSLKATQEGFPCLGLGGVWGFRSDGALLKDFQQIEFRNRNVVVVMDSDYEFNFNVARAGYALALELSKLGAKTRVLPLPEITEEALNG